MAEFLLVDPAAGRREILRRVLGPAHRVAEYNTLPGAVCQGRSFQAAFLAWPEGLATPDQTLEKLGWSCEHLALMMNDPGAEKLALNWGRKVLPQASVFPFYCAGRPLSVPEIMGVLKRVLDPTSLALPQFIGSSAAMHRLLAAAARAAANNWPVLILGEPGTGKETLARWIHANGPRGREGGPFETFHCAGMDSTQAYSELFGHEKGAFTWATNAKRGLLEKADGGTLYIHEVCDLDKTLQFKLLHWFERPTAGFERLGGLEGYNVDVRIIAGTRWPLRQKLGQDFSSELFYRLRQNAIEILPLRARSEDIPQLVEYFVARKLGGSFKGLKWEGQALSKLEQYSWPENLNELEAVLEDILLRKEDGSEVKCEHLPARIRHLVAPNDWAAIRPSELPTDAALSPEAHPDSDETNASPRSAPITPEGPLISEESTEIQTPDEVNGQPQVRSEGDVYYGYKLIREIATTRLSQVFLSEREFDGELVVTKFSRVWSDDQIKAMQKAMTLGRRKAKFMVPIDYAIKYQGGYLAVLACLDDVLRGQRIERNLYQPRTFRRWIEDFRKITGPSWQQRREALGHLEIILSALGSFHDQELVFNDVKPENFGFYQGRLMAVDYGGVTFRGRRPHETTPEYDLPEREPKRAEPARDVFAVAKMIAETFYGLPPGDLQPRNIMSLAEPYLSERRLFDRLVWTIIGKGLDSNPAMRYQSAKQMIEHLAELERQIEDDPVEGE